MCPASWLTASNGNKEQDNCRDQQHMNEEAKVQEERSRYPGYNQDGSKDIKHFFSDC